jgi:toxin-antitoxin system PIN domain toxin
VSSTLDANLLVYASNADDPAYTVARALLDQLAAGPDIVVLFWPVLLGYQRIVTHPAILPRPLSPRIAAANIQSLISQPHVRTPGEETGFWDRYRENGGESARGNDVPDTHLVALMRQHGVRTIYSRDRGLRRFDGIEVRDPFR